MLACDLKADDTNQRDKYRRKYTIDLLYNDEKKINIPAEREGFFGTGKKQIKGIQIAKEFA